MKTKITLILCALSLALCLTHSCKSSPESKKSGLPLIQESSFRYKDPATKHNIRLYTIHNADLTMQVTDYGARIVSLFTPDRDGHYDDVIVGYEKAERFVNNPANGERFFGAVVGRVANRICLGLFTLDKQVYRLPLNDKTNTLHGGNLGLDRVIWKLKSKNDTSLVFSYLAPDGQDGFPGNLDITVTYALTSDNSLDISYSATTDKATPVNISNHAFFNLKGSCGGNILTHIMTIDADFITPVNSALIPTGTLMGVYDTPFDFRTPKTIGRDINDDHPQLVAGKGYDHNFVLTRIDDGQMRKACTVYEPVFGRKMEVSTDQPGLQFYSGNFLDGSYCGKNPDVPIGYRNAFVLETQRWPDSVNQQFFPNTILRPGEVYSHHSIYHFSAN